MLFEFSTPTLHFSYSSIFPSQSSVLGDATWFGIAAECHISSCLKLLNELSSVPFSDSSLFCDDACTMFIKLARNTNAVLMSTAEMILEVLSFIYMVCFSLYITHEQYLECWNVILVVHMLIFVFRRFSLQLCSPVFFFHWICWCSAQFWLLVVNVYFMETFWAFSQLLLNNSSALKFMYVCVIENKCFLRGCAHSISCCMLKLCDIVELTYKVEVWAEIHAQNLAFNESKARIQVEKLWPSFWTSLLMKG